MEKSRLGVFGCDEGGDQKAALVMESKLAVLVERRESEGSASRGEQESRVWLRGGRGSEGRVGRGEQVRSV